MTDTYEDGRDDNHGDKQLDALIDGIIEAPQRQDPKADLVSGVMRQVAAEQPQQQEQDSSLLAIGIGVLVLVALVIAGEYFYLAEIKQDMSISELTLSYEIPYIEIACLALFVPLLFIVLSSSAKEKSA